MSAKGNESSERKKRIRIVFNPIGVCGELGCEKVVAFGDGKNDIDMFELADEGYAVENAHED